MRWINIVFACAGIGLAISAMRASEKKPEPSPHHNAGQCRTCHLDNPTMPGSGGERSRTTLVRDADQICKSCHEVKEGLSHPSGVAMSWTPPETMPLDWAGRLTCVTCHYMHAEGKSDKTGFMIRTETVGREFCEKCHSDMKDAEGGKHRQFLDKSHMETPDTAAQDRASLDFLSRECLGCHVGRIQQTYSPLTERRITVFQHGQIQSTHPIAVDYPPVGVDAMRYTDTKLLDKRIHLYNGKIGCGTCHEPFTMQKSGLVMANSEDQLCLQCHAMNKRKPTL